jgi:hypothetical protein
MAYEIGPDEAAGALQEIGRRSEQTIDSAAIPTWYWWAIGALMVGLALGVDTRRPAVVGVAVSAFVVGVLAATARVVFGGLRRARVRNDLLGAQGVLAILGLDALVLAISLPIAFALAAAHVAHPAAIGVTIGAVAMVVGGPLLNRYLRRVMVANRNRG